jgi:hypothetical protein
VPSALHLAERTQEFVDDGKAGCEYFCWETFYGVLGPVIKMVEGKRFETGFESWMEGLKGFVREVRLNELEGSGGV